MPDIGSITIILNHKKSSAFDRKKGFAFLKYKKFLGQL